MKLLVLGTGGREHAIAWKLKQSSHEVFLHPGNSGTLKVGFSNLGAAHSKEEIALAAKENQVSLIIIGPEILLAQDYASYFREMGFLVVGPGKEGAQLETSKIFSKEFMVRAHIPTAPFKIYDQFDEFSQEIGRGKYPKVLKLDGLAAGKGVVISKTPKQAIEFAENVWIKNTFGPPPHKIIEEEFIAGFELSYLGFCDGKTFTPLASSTDFKRIFDQNEGPNTGGMGAVSPSPYFNLTLENKIHEQIVDPILNTLQKEKIDFRGILYIGIMVDKDQNPFVLEFNTRFGDPETQSLMLRIEGDLLPALLATAEGNLASATPLNWKNETSVYVVAATAGYPESPQVGDAIQGWETCSPHTQLFFAGVSSNSSGLVTAGGRVLGIGAMGKDLTEARERAYNRLKSIQWKGIHYRKDIGLFS